MKKVHVIIKVTDACNLRCKYCYNSHTHYTKEILSLERFEKLLTLLAKDYERIELVWHGGEPMSVGLDYYKKAVEIEDKIYLQTNAKIVNSMQTNGTLIDDKWVAFFKKYKFQPGISFDGLHNENYRQQTQKTLQAIQLLQKADFKVGCLAVVADESYDMLENYKYLRDLGVSVAFSPMFHEGGGEGLQGVSAEYYIQQTNKLFDYWLHDKNGTTVKDFRSFVSMAMGGYEKVCTNSSCLGKWLSITADGTLYNCGRDAIKAYPYEHIDEIQAISEAYKSEGFYQMLKGSIARRQKCKASCEYFEFCEGGCPDMAILENGLGEIPQFSCACFKGIFSHIQSKMQEIIQNKTPLDTLNPTIRAVAIKCLSDAGEKSN